MLDAVRKSKTKLTREKNAFKNAMELVGIKTETEIDLFGGNAVSRVADITVAVRKASDRLYTACQTEIPLLDAQCRPLLAHDPSTRAVKEVTALIQKLNKESEISTNFRGNLNGGSFHDLVGVRYIPSIDNKMIQTFWENKYSEMPGTAAEDKAYASRESKARKEENVNIAWARQKLRQEEREEAQRKKQAQEQARQERLARMAENAAQTAQRRAYLQRAREIFSCCSSKHAYVQADGTVATKHNWAYSSAGDTSGFRDIRSVVCTEEGFVGLKYDGTCVSTVPDSDSKSNLRDVRQWHGVVALAAGAYHVVGLRKDGTCLATTFKREGSFQDRGQGYVGSWTDVVEIACGRDCTLGLRKDGTVLYAGAEGPLAEEVKKLTDIAMIAASDVSILAVTKKGEVLFGNNAMNKAENVVQVAVVGREPYALQADGTLLGGTESVFSSERENSVIVDRNVVALFGNNGLSNQLCYLREDGTLHAYNGYAKSKLSDVEGPLFESYDAYWQMREEEAQARQAKAQQMLAWREAGVCQHCGAAFKKALLGFKCSRCGQRKDY